MSRGRKPSATAISRRTEAVAAVVEAPEALPMPRSVAGMPDAAECWHFITDGQTRFKPKEAPLLEAYCIEYAIARQSAANMVRPDGSIQTFYTDPHGNLKRNPDVDTYSKAVDQMRKLSGVLGLDTLTDARLNLTKTATTNLAADIPNKVFAAMKAIQDGG